MALTDITTSFTNPAIPFTEILGDDNIVAGIVNTTALNWLEQRLLEFTNLTNPPFFGYFVLDINNDQRLTFEVTSPTSVTILGYSLWVTDLLNQLVTLSNAPIIPPIQCSRLCTPDRNNQALVTNNPVLPNGYGLVVRIPADQSPIIANPSIPLYTQSGSSLVSSFVIKNSAGVLYEITGYSQATGFIQIFNSISLPVNGTTPLISFGVEAEENFFRSLERGLSFSNGIVVGLSTTLSTLTISTTSEVRIEGYFI